MRRLWAWLLARPDAVTAMLLFGGYLWLLLATAGSLGFSRDEGFYFASARVYSAWLTQLWQHPSEALSRSVLDRYWSTNHEHPSLMKLLFALSNRWLSGAFSETSVSFRFPAMALSSLAVAVTYLWGRRSLGRAGALVAALSFGFMPRVFFHAHLACFDLPVCALWLVTGYVYVRSVETPGRRWLLAAGVAYGLFLDTKHNSWIFPGVVLLHFGLAQGPACWRELRVGSAWWRRLPLAWVSMALLGPALFLALWPWLWHDTLPRLREYVTFHTQHEYYNMEFLGRTYWKPPMPRAYAWLMTLATVPLVTLVLGALGGASLWKRASAAPLARRSDQLFWAVSIAASYAPWLSTSTPIFGGTKHWLTAYPFLCLFAGLGFEKVLVAVRALKPRLGNPLLVGACVLAGPIVMTWHAHPFGLSQYTPLVGGAPGAATLGLNRSFWGYTTQALAPAIDQRVPRRGTLYLHDTAPQSFAMFQEDGRLRRDINGTLNIAASDVALYHYEPHMSRAEQQIWVDYATTAPDAVATFDGVPIAWAYVRNPSTR